MLNEKEKKKARIIRKVISHEITRTDAAKKLNLSIRQIDRLVKRHMEQGEEGLAHKSRGKISPKKLEKEKEENAIDLYLGQYSELNFTHFYDETKDQLQMSYSSLFRVFTKDGILSTMAQKKTIAKYYAMMNEAIQQETVSEAQIQLFQKRQEEEKRKHIRRSSVNYSFGEEVQMDAAFAIWFGTEVTALHLAVDRGTKKVLAGWFDFQELTRGYMILLMNTLFQYGRPKKIRTDKRGTFSINTKRKQYSQLNFTQFGRICRELDIILESSSDPTFKPNVERENNTFKNRLIAELKLKGITDCQEANRYLNEVFIPKMNDKFSFEIEPDKIAMQDNIYTKEELNLIISEQYPRKIDNASSFKYNGDYYMPVDKQTGEVISYKKGTICTVIIAFDFSLWCKVDNQIHIMLKVEKKFSTPYQKTTKTQEEINRSKAHKPSANHPWRNYNKN